MDFDKALRNVVRFADQKSEGAERLLRFCQAAGDIPAYVTAWSGGVGVVVLVDVDLPSAVVVAADVAAVVKGFPSKGGVPGLRLQAEGQTLRFASENFSAEVGQVGLREWETPQPYFPGHVPLFQEWPHARKVLHATGAGFLDLVSFGHGFVGATDKRCVARVQMRPPLRGLYPSKMFKYLGKTAEVRATMHGGTGFVQVGLDEYRYAEPVEEGRYSDLFYLVPRQHSGPAAVVDVAALRDAVKAAASASSEKWVALSFAPAEGITVRAYQEGEGTRFETRVPAHACDAESEVLVDGKLLADGLREADTPRVRLCYGSPTDPLLVESGSFQKSVWPLR